MWLSFAAKFHDLPIEQLKVTKLRNKNLEESEKDANSYLITSLS